MAAALADDHESPRRCKGRGPKFIKLGESKQSGVCYDPADIEEWKAVRKFASTSAATVSHPGDA